MRSSESNMQSRNELEEITLQFFHQVQNRTSWEDMQRFYHPNIQQIEYPNAITKATAMRTLPDLQAASERGQKVLQKEEYEVVKLYSSDNTVIAEAIWTGTLAIPIGTLAVGDKMTAHFAQFLSMKRMRKILRRDIRLFDKEIMIALILFRFIPSTTF